ncbi:MAG TPA: tetratricopeptide repeat protein [Gemmatimonadota bacterium]|nr:tetratricopeptide repeat protein [Gemmatimonadota bacterium]
MRSEVTWLVAAAGLMVAGCDPEGAASEARGDRYSARGQFADAAVEYGIALEAAGDDAPSELRLKTAELALRSKDFNAAERMFDALIERDPEYAGRVRALYYLHARRWTAQGDTFATLRAIDGIRHRDSTATLGSLYYALGDAAFSRPDYDAAIEAYLMGLARIPEEAEPEVYARLADAYEQRRDCSAAIAYLERYLQAVRGLATDDEEVRYRLGSCSYRLAERAFANEDYAAAATYLRALLDTGQPPNLMPEALLMMGRIQERSGNRSAAMDYYQRVIDEEEDRETPVALQAFRRLKQLEFGFPLDTDEGPRSPSDDGRGSSGAPES